MKQRTRVRLEYSVYGRDVNLNKGLEVLRALLQANAGNQAAKVFDQWALDTAQSKKRPRRKVTRASA